MVLDAVSNFVRGTTDAAVDDSQTTVSVTDASIFPDPSTDGEFNVVIWDVNNFPRPDQDTDVEILRVTAIDTGTDTLTVARGQEMTVAAAHPSGSAVHLSPTAKMFSDIEDTFADFWDASAQELTGDVNNSVVNTGSANIANNVSLTDIYTLEDTTDGNVAVLELIEESGSNPQTATANQSTLGVSTSATVIMGLFPQTDVLGLAAHIIVIGSNQSSPTGDIFIDTLQIARNGVVNISGTSERGTPAARSYNVSTNDLELSMASGTYDIVAFATMAYPTP